MLTRSLPPTQHFDCVHYTRMPLPTLQQLGNHFSTILHHLVYSFPSPNSTNASATAYEPVRGAKDDGGHGGLSGLQEMITEPGEPRALAGGVGPLSFVGSGYGVTLVLMVSVWHLLACLSCL